MNFLFDLKKKDITLGGFLTFRKECEIIAEIKKKNTIRVFLDFYKKDKKKINYFVKEVLMTSSKKFLIKKKLKNTYVWNNNLEHYPNYSFMKINFLFKKYKKFPKLAWSNKIISKNNMFINNYNNKIITVHLKQIKPYNHIGNANLEIWLNFFKQNKDFIFLIIGHDHYPLNFKSDNLIILKEKIKKLSFHLALVQQSKAFIGTASGVTTAANFSDKPYIIFKEPKHDTEQILKELKHKNYYFAKKGQKIVRKQVNKLELNNAIKYLKKFIKKK